MKPILISWLMVVAVLQSSAQTGPSNTFSVFFATNATDLDANERAKLKDALQRLPSYAHHYRIDLKAYADEDGSTAYNDQLAEQRAKAVKALLFSNGFTQKQIRSEVIGERKKRKEGEGEDVKAQNRAVELTFRISSETMAKVHFPKSENKSSFTFQNRQATLLEAADGTQLIVPADAFVYADGTPASGEIKLNYTYYRRPEDFVLSDIEMRHSIGNELYYFASSGMFELSATCNGKELELAKGKSIETVFEQEPTNEQPNLYTYDATTKTWTMQQSLPANASSALARNSLDFFGSNLFAAWPMKKEYKRVAADVPGKIDLRSLKWDVPIAYARIGNYMTALKGKRSDWKTILPALCEAGKHQLSLEEGKLLMDVNTLKSKISDAQHALKLMDQTYQITQVRMRETSGRFKVESNKTVGSEMWPMRETFFSADRTPLEQLLQRTRVFEDVYLAQIEGDTFMMFVNNNDTTKLQVELQMVNRPMDAKECNAAMLVYNEQRKEKEEERKALLASLNLSFQALDSVTTELTSYRLDPLRTCTQVPSVKLRSGDHVFELEAIYSAMKGFSGGSQKHDLESWLYYAACMPPRVTNKMVLVTSKYAKQREMEDVSCTAWFNKVPALPPPAVQRTFTADTTAAGSNVRQWITNSTSSFACDQLAVYNCDQIARIAAPVEVFADYIDEKGTPVKPVVIRLIMNGMNGMFQYDGYGNLGPRRFYASQRNKHVLVAADENGNVYMIKNIYIEPLASGSPERPKIFTLEQINKENAKEEISKAILDMEIDNMASLEK